MTRVLLSIFGLLLSLGVMAQSTLQGKVSDAATGEPILFGNVALYQNGSLITGAETDFDGNYVFSNIDPGTYDVEISYVGYSPTRTTDVVIQAGKVTKLDLQLTQGVVTDEVVITGYKVPLIEFDNTSTGNTVTAEQIRSLPVKNLNAIAATGAGLSSVDGGDISIRGSRTNATVYYIDGIRTSGRIPQSEVEQLQVITGGVEAKYGDVTGGVISLTSKGPSAKYTGGVEVETSEGLDNVGYNLLSANISGPIIKNGDKSLLGFRFSGQYIKQADDRVSALGVYRLSEEQIRALEANPTSALDANGTSLVPSAEFLTKEEIGGTVAQRPNEDREQLDITAKLEARITDGIDVSLSGSFTDISNRFTPGGDGGNRRWALMNWVNNPFDYQDRLRGNFRFRHKIGNQASSATEEEKANPSALQNFQYSIQLGFERGKRNQEDFRHEDNLFNYGYLGSIDRQWNPVASTVDDPENFAGQVIRGFNPQVGAIQAFSHQGYAEVQEGFVPNSEINPILAKYQNENGFLNTNSNYYAFGDLFTNVGAVYNSFFKSENDIYTLNIASGFDFLPGGSEKGRHNIQFGFLYEQRVSRSWSINPRGLWQLARVTANSHILGVDYNTVVGTFPGDPNITYLDSLNNPIEGVFNQYQTLISSDVSSKFIRSVRQLQNKTLHDYVNVDGLNPADLSLDMFSAQELNNANFNLLSFNYRGYDYLGNKVSTSTTFDDFFTGRNEDGTRRFDVAPFMPVYASGYIQDKFTYKDIIFRLGVRVDYFDANTKVLKDPYSLYEIETAEDFFNRTGQQKPASVGNDYRVYVAEEGSTEVVGYRVGDQWYQPNGTAVSSGALLFQGGLVYPSTRIAADGDETELPTIQEEGFDLNYSFEDYKPQINVMPRLAFSFPISDEAGFFAHYDVLTQRPTNNRVTALDYFYFNDRARTNGQGPINDPNLKPVRTVDYQVGFQQKLTNSSAMKISAYYRELRDLIQRRFYTFVPTPLNNYEAYGNLDFSTVKGFSFQYDRRRTNNLQLTATYTLQFADGSGSDANSSGGLNTRGPIRTLLPLDFDERHRITSTLDYRFGQGEGPVLFGKNVFANTGLNLITTAVSGRPYTKRIQADQFAGEGYQGAINGERLPWNFNIDARLDKTWSFTTNQESGRKVYLNVYVRAENLLDTRNVIGVYEFTGDPDDDGYLLSSFGQDRVRLLEGNGQNSDNYLNMYQMALLEPGNYTLPRRMYIGAVVDF